MKCFLFFILSFSCWKAQSYWIISPTLKLDPQIQTRILVAGRGDELGTLFQLAAISKAEHLLKQDPKIQILILSAIENEQNKTKEINQFKSRGFTTIKNKPGSLGAREFFKEAANFKKIISIEFFTHATVKYGLRLDRAENRLESMDPWAELRANLTENAYIFMHGCNTGFELAPAVAKILNRPVMGSLTSTYFQRLTKDSVFLMSDDPRGRGRWLEPAVYRLMPDNKPYEGHWGQFSGGGLGFFKTFCGQMNSSECGRTMKLMVQDWVSIETEKLTRTADFLCSGRLDTAHGKRCQESLKTSNRSFQFFRGPPLKCDFQGCEFELLCPQFDDKCDLTNDADGTDTIFKEYEKFVSP